MHRGAQRGTYNSGNYRGSVFRKRVGETIIERDGLQDECPQWGVGSIAGRDLRLGELEMERQVSEYIRRLPFLWVDVDDEPGPDSDRVYIKRNAIALVSYVSKESIDTRREEWLDTIVQSQISSSPACGTSITSRKTTHPTF